MLFIFFNDYFTENSPIANNRAYHFLLRQQFSHFNFFTCSFSPQKTKSKTRRKKETRLMWTMSFTKRNWIFAQFSPCLQTFLCEIIRIKSSPSPLPLSAAQNSYLSTEFVAIGVLSRCFHRTRQTGPFSSILNKSVKLTLRQC